jgi:hypothetical protein
MKTELYKKVYIKSEVDLPKEDGVYFCHYKRFGENSTHLFKTNLARKTTWETEIDWYLQPIEQIEQLEPVTAEENIIESFCDKHNITKETLIDVYLEYLKNAILSVQPAVQLTDEEIEKQALIYATTIINGHKSWEQIDKHKKKLFIFAAKWYRDQIKVSLRDELVKFVKWIIKDQKKPTESDTWISRDTVDEYLKPKQ